MQSRAEPDSFFKAIHITIDSRDDSLALAHSLAKLILVEERLSSNCQVMIHDSKAEIDFFIISRQLDSLENLLTRWTEGKRFSKRCSGGESMNLALGESYSSGGSPEIFRANEDKSLLCYDFSIIESNESREG